MTRRAQGAGARERRVDRAQLRAAALGAARRRALCAVVKADGYGHGAVASAARRARGRRELAGGGRRARGCAELRDAGLRDVRVLVMGALSPRRARARRSRAGADVVVWSERQRARGRATRAAAACTSSSTRGMGRLGTRDAARRRTRCRRRARRPEWSWSGVMTHFATADELDDDGFFARQLDGVRALGAAAQGRAARADRARGQQRRDAARSRARTSTWCAAGSPIYGMDPFGRDPAARGLEPALELSSYVAEVKLCARGRERRLRPALRRRARHLLGVLPIGYGDGWRRGPVQQRRRADRRSQRHPLVGTVSMDNVTVELGERRPRARASRRARRS